MILSSIHTLAVGFLFQSGTIGTIGTIENSSARYSIQEKTQQLL